MPKPTTIGGYSSPVTEACERVLVTLLRGLGPYKTSVFLIGGLAPRYLIRARPPAVAPHAGTGDVDVVIDLSILADTDAYHSLEDNLKRMGFERATNKDGVKLSWRWQTQVDERTTLLLEFLADAPDIAGGKVEPLPTQNEISALNIPHSSIVFDLYETVEVTAELLGSNGQTTEIVQYADIVSYTCLKAFAFEGRGERKDAHDMVYCLENAAGGGAAVVAKFQAALAGQHESVIRSALDILARRFSDDDRGEGYRKDGPVAAARFELGDDDDDEDARDRRLLRQRQVAELVTRLLADLSPPA